MRIKSFLAALLLMIVGLQTAWGQGFRVYQSDGTMVEFDMPVDSIVFFDGSGGTIGGHEYVEIGGLKWATMNVGATTVAGSFETCYGDYFAWGETEPRYNTITRSSLVTTFTWRDGYSKGYSADNYPGYYDTTLDAEHDAATTKWGHSWRTPTKADFEALAMACSGSSSNDQRPVDRSKITEGGIYWLYSWQTDEPAYTGVAGLLFVSKADISKRVFFPAAGRVDETTLNNYGSHGSYWSSSFYESDTHFAHYMSFHPSFVNPSRNELRCRGFTVRPVSN